MDVSKLLKGLVSENSGLLVPHIDAYQRRGVFPKEWNIKIANFKTKRDHGKAKIRFSAGSDALASPTSLYNKFTRPTEEPISSSLRRTFDVGTFWHCYLQAMLLDMGFVDEKGIEQYVVKKVKDGPGYCSGLGDLVGVRIPGNGTWLVDIKTSNAKSFKTGIAPYLWDKYVAQVNLYGDWFGLSKMMILMVEKDSPHDLKEVVIPQDKELVQNIYTKWNYVANCIAEGIPPSDDPEVYREFA